MNKRTENERKADALLNAARLWQNGRGCFSDGTEFDEQDLLIMDLFDVVEWNRSDSNRQWFTDCASAALSEVAGMGYDIVDARTGK